MHITIMTGKSRLGNAFRWIFGVSGALGAIMALFTSILASFGYLLTALILLPPMDKIYKEKLNFELSTGMKAMIVIFGFLLAGTGMIYSSIQDELQAGTIERVVPQKAYIDESLSSILSKFTSSNSPLTDLQKEELWKTDYKGKNVKGSIYVYGVDKGLFGGYTILGDLTPRGQYDVGSDFAVFFKSSEKEKLLRVSKNSKIMFEGKLDDYHPFMGNLDIVDAIIS